MMNLIPFLFALTAPHIDTPPPAPQRMIWLATNTYHADRPGGSSSAAGRPVELNKPMTFFTFSKPNMCGFSAGTSITQFAPDALFGWKVTILPTAVSLDEVRLNVTWSRERNHKVEAEGSTQVLMRPGDIVPLDVISTPDSKRLNNCQITSASAVLECDPVSFGKFSVDRSSVVSIDMWLVRRLADGSEQTQQINVRGALNEEVPFYFADMRSNNVLMSVLGAIRARERDNGTIALEFEIERHFRSGTTDLGRGFSNLAPARPVLTVQPDTVASIEFPLSSNSSWGEFAGERVSIRLKANRIR